jgi:hypothetical protein
VGLTGSAGGGGCSFFADFVFAPGSLSPRVVFLTCLLCLLRCADGAVRGFAAGFLVDRVVAANTGGADGRLGSPNLPTDLILVRSTARLVILPARSLVALTFEGRSSEEVDSSSAASARCSVSSSVFPVLRRASKPNVIPAETITAPEASARVLIETTLRRAILPGTNLPKSFPRANSAGENLRVEIGGEGASGCVV